MATRFALPVTLLISVISIGFGQGNPAFRPSTMLTAESIKAANSLDINALRTRAAAGDVCSRVYTRLSPPHWSQGPASRHCPRSGIA